MKYQSLKQAWRIWILPVCLLYAEVFVFMFIFDKVTSDLLPENDTIYYLAEGILTFVGFGFVLAIWYIIMIRYELITEQKVRKRIKMSWVFFCVVYLVFTAILLSELAEVP